MNKFKIIGTLEQVNNNIPDICEKKLPADYITSAKKLGIFDLIKRAFRNLKLDLPPVSNKKTDYLETFGEKWETAVYKTVAFFFLKAIQRYPHLDFKISYPAISVPVAIPKKLHEFEFMKKIIEVIKEEKATAKQATKYIKLYCLKEKLRTAIANKIPRQSADSSIDYQAILDEIKMTKETFLIKALESPEALALALNEHHVPLEDIVLILRTYTPRALAAKTNAQNIAIIKEMITSGLEGIRTISYPVDLTILTNMDWVELDRDYLSNTIPFSHVDIIRRKLSESQEVKESIQKEFSIDSMEGKQIKEFIKLLTCWRYLKNKKERLAIREEFILAGIDLPTKSKYLHSIFEALYDLAIAVNRNPDKIVEEQAFEKFIKTMLEKDGLISTVLQFEPSDETVNYHNLNFAPLPLEEILSDPYELLEESGIVLASAKLGDKRVFDIFDLNASISKTNDYETMALYGNVMGKTTFCRLGSGNASRLENTAKPSVKTYGITLAIQGITSLIDYFTNSLKLKTKLTNLSIAGIIKGKFFPSYSNPVSLIDEILAYFDGKMDFLGESNKPFLDIVDSEKIIFGIVPDLYKKVCDEPVHDWFKPKYNEQEILELDDYFGNDGPLKMQKINSKDHSPETPIYVKLEKNYRLATNDELANPQISKYTYVYQDSIKVEKKVIDNQPESILHLYAATGAKISFDITDSADAHLAKTLADKYMPGGHLTLLLLELGIGGQEQFFTLADLREIMKEKNITRAEIANSREAWKGPNGVLALFKNLINPAISRAQQKRFFEGKSGENIPPNNLQFVYDYKQEKIREYYKNNFDLIGGFLVETGKYFTQENKFEILKIFKDEVIKEKISLPSWLMDILNQRNRKFLESKQLDQEELIDLWAKIYAFYKANKEVGGFTMYIDGADLSLITGVPLHLAYEGYMLKHFGDKLHLSALPFVLASQAKGGGALSANVQGYAQIILDLVRKEDEPASEIISKKFLDKLQQNSSRFKKIPLPQEGSNERGETGVLADLYKDPKNQYINRMAPILSDTFFEILREEPLILKVFAKIHPRLVVQEKSSFGHPAKPILAEALYQYGLTDLMLVTWLVLMYQETKRPGYCQKNHDLDLDKLSSNVWITINEGEEISLLKSTDINDEQTGLSGPVRANAYNCGLIFQDPFAVFIPALIDLNGNRYEVPARIGGFFLRWMIKKIKDKAKALWFGVNSSNPLTHGLTTPSEKVNIVTTDNFRDLSYPEAQTPGYQLNETVEMIIITPAELERIKREESNVLDQRIDYIFSQAKQVNPEIKSWQDIYKNNQNGPVFLIVTPGVEDSATEQKTVIDYLKTQQLYAEGNHTGTIPEAKIFLNTIPNAPAVNPKQGDFQFIQKVVDAFIAEREIPASVRKVIKGKFYPEDSQTEEDAKKLIGGILIEMATDPASPWHKVIKGMADLEKFLDTLERGDFTKVEELTDTWGKLDKADNIILHSWIQPQNTRNAWNILKAFWMAAGHTIPVRNYDVLITALPLNVFLKEKLRKAKFDYIGMLKGQPTILSEMQKFLGDKTLLTAVIDGTFPQLVEVLVQQQLLGGFMSALELRTYAKTLTPKDLAEKNPDDYLFLDITFYNDTGKKNDVALSIDDNEINSIGRFVKEQVESDRGVNQERRQFNNKYIVNALFYFGLSPFIEGGLKKVVKDTADLSQKHEGIFRNPFVMMDLLKANYPAIATPEKLDENIRPMIEMVPFEGAWHMALFCGARNRAIQNKTYEKQLSETPKAQTPIIYHFKNSGYTNLQITFPGRAETPYYTDSDLGIIGRTGDDTADYTLVYGKDSTYNSNVSKISAAKTTNLTSRGDNAISLGSIFGKLDTIERAVLARLWPLFSKKDIDANPLNYFYFTKDGTRYFISPLALLVHSPIGRVTLNVDTTNPGKAKPVDADVIINDKPVFNGINLVENVPASLNDFVMFLNACYNGREATKEERYGQKMKNFFDKNRTHPQITTWNFSTKTFSFNKQLTSIESNKIKLENTLLAPDELKIGSGQKDFVLNDLPPLAISSFVVKGLDGNLLDPEAFRSLQDLLNGKILKSHLCGNYFGTFGGGGNPIFLSELQSVYNNKTKKIEHTLVFQVTIAEEHVQTAQATDPLIKQLRNSMTPLQNPEVDKLCRLLQGSAKDPAKIDWLTALESRLNGDFSTTRGYDVREIFLNLLVKTDKMNGATLTSLYRKSLTDETWNKNVFTKNLRSALNIKLGERSLRFTFDDLQNLLSLLGTVMLPEPLPKSPFKFDQEIAASAANYNVFPVCLKLLMRAIQAGMSDVVKGNEYTWKKTKVYNTVNFIWKNRENAQLHLLEPEFFEFLFLDIIYSAEIKADNNDKKEGLAYCKLLSQYYTLLLDNMKSSAKNNLDFNFIGKIYKCLATIKNTAQNALDDKPNTKLKDDLLRYIAKPKPTQTQISYAYNERRDTLDTSFKWGIPLGLGMLGAGVYALYAYFVQSYSPSLYYIVQWFVLSGGLSGLISLPFIPQWLRNWASNYYNRDSVAVVNELLKSVFSTERISTFITRLKFLIPLTQSPIATFEEWLSAGLKNRIKRRILLETSQKRAGSYHKEEKLNAENPFLDNGNEQISLVGDNPTLLPDALMVTPDRVFSQKIMAEKLGLATAQSKILFSTLTNKGYGRTKLPKFGSYGFISLYDAFYTKTRIGLLTFNNQEDFLKIATWQGGVNIASSKKIFGDEYAVKFFWEIWPRIFGYNPSGKEGYLDEHPDNEDLYRLTWFGPAGNWRNSDGSFISAELARKNLDKYLKWEKNKNNPIAWNKLGESLEVLRDIPAAEVWRMLKETVSDLRLEKDFDKTQWGKWMLNSFANFQAIQEKIAEYYP